MGHELDTTNGITSFADSRTRQIGGETVVDAWHRLGTPVGHLMTVDEALDAAHMRNWNVRKLPLVANLAEDGDDAISALAKGNIVVPDRYVVVRDNPVTKATQPLGVVGNRWTPFANEATTPLLSGLVEEGGAHIETIGALREGRDTFVTMKLPAHMTFTSPITGVEDVTDLYIIILNNHNGEAPLRALISPVRVVCANTQRVAEGTARSTISLRHTGNPQSRLAEVREMLGLSFAFRDTFVAQCERLIEREVSNVVVMDVISDVFGVNAATTERQRDSRTETAKVVMANYLNSPTVAPFLGTAFGAYNAVTEYIDHLSPVTRGGDNVAARRAERNLINGWPGEIKAKTMTALLPV